MLVAALFYMPKLNIQVGFNLKILPAFHAALNFLTTILLLAGFYFIKNKKIFEHRACMITAFIFSAIFLVSYVVYHALAEPIRYPGVGLVRKIYFFLLITHIFLAAAIVPLVLVTLVKALSQRFDQHRKIARITLPLWLYVTSTGVIIYLMILPYY